MAGANVKNYLSNENSSFFALEDVDDDEFLKNSRNRNFSTQPSHYNRGSNALEERKLQLIQQKQRIEAESLDSTERSLRLLRESEDLGISTAEELQKQREQLERSERNLDTINSTLRYTKKKLDGFKSVFGSIKNYLTKSSDSPAIASVSPDNKETSKERTPYLPQNKSLSSPDEHPAFKIRSYDDNPLSVNDRIEHNINEISISVKNIKHLAINLGEEIESQNELVDRIQDKVDKSDITLTKQNKEMSKLINKK